MIDHARFADICRAKTVPTRLFDMERYFRWFCIHHGWRYLPDIAEVPGECRIRVWQGNHLVSEAEAPTYDECFYTLAVVLHSNIVAMRRASGCVVLAFPSGEEL